MRGAKVVHLCIKDDAIMFFAGRALWSSRVEFGRSDYTHAEVNIYTHGTLKACEIPSTLIHTRLYIFERVADARNFVAKKPGERHACRSFSCNSTVITVLTSNLVSRVIDFARPRTWTPTVFAWSSLIRQCLFWYRKRIIEKFTVREKW